MARVTIRMWNKEGYHKDVAMLSGEQVLSYTLGMEATGRTAFESPINATRVIVDPQQFPEATSFEVIVERTK